MDHLVTIHACRLVANCKGDPSAPHPFLVKIFEGVDDWMSARYAECYQWTESRFEQLYLSHNLVPNSLFIKRLAIFVMGNPPSGQFSVSRRTPRSIDENMKRNTAWSCIGLEIDYQVCMDIEDFYNFTSAPQVRGLMNFVHARLALQETRLRKMLSEEVLNISKNVLDEFIHVKGEICPYCPGLESREQTYVDVREPPSDLEE